MKAKISLITLGVSDLARSIEFYRDGLGFPRHGDHAEVAFFEMEGTWLSLYARDKLAEDATVENSSPSTFSGFTLAHNVASPDEVDSVLQHAVAAGARLIKPGRKADWGGYSGYFADPDGFLWEVAWNPFMDLT
jgi:catechol 2,3-dioxygenase-like lactoylglutathione lyase family enzyme